MAEAAGFSNPAGAGEAWGLVELAIRREQEKRGGGGFSNPPGAPA